MDIDTKENSNGFVYFFVTASHEFVKIGISKKVDERHKTIQTACPVKIAKVFHIACSDPLGLEKIMHRRFRHERSHGEWFSPGESLELALLIDCLEKGAISKEADIHGFIKTMDRQEELALQLEEILSDRKWARFDMPALSMVLAMRAVACDLSPVYEDLTLKGSPHLHVDQDEDESEDIDVAA